MLLDGVSKGKFGAYLVMVAAPIAQSPQITRLLEFRDDPLYRPLGDADRLSHLPHPCFRSLGDVQSSSKRSMAFSCIEEGDIPELFELMSPCAREMKANG